MPIPDFIVELRKKIGHDLLWLPAVTMVVLDEEDRVLLVKRADNHQWTLVTGYLDPGEQPAVGAVREIQEETGVVAAVERLLRVHSSGPGVCVNGDKVQWMDVAFLCRPVGGEAKVNDDESIDVGWFALDDMPELDAHQSRCLADALDDGAAAGFDT